MRDSGYGSGPYIDIINRLEETISPLRQEEPDIPAIVDALWVLKIRWMTN